VYLINCFRFLSYKFWVDCLFDVYIFRSICSYFSRVNYVDACDTFLPILF